MRSPARSFRHRQPHANPILIAAVMAAVATSLPAQLQFEELGLRLPLDSDSTLSVATGDGDRGPGYRPHSAWSLWTPWNQKPQVAAGPTIAAHDSRGHSRRRASADRDVTAVRDQDALPAGGATG